MKILQVITELGGGGAEKIIAALSEQLIRAGHHVTVLSLQSAPENRTIPERLERTGCTVIYLNGKKYDPFLVWKLRQKIKELSPDIIHSHLIHPNLLSRLACAGLSGPLLVNTIHTAEKRKNKGFYFLLDRLTWRMADHLTAVSEAAAMFHEQHCGLHAGTISVIPNGLSPVQPAKPERCREVKTQLGINEDERIIACIGRLDEMKGFQYLPERLDSIASKIPDGEKWVIVIFGNGILYPVLAGKSAVHPEKLRIVCAGFYPDAPSLLTMADVFLSTSLCEGYGLAAAEAMSLGLPLVCNSTDAIPELCRRYTGKSFLFDMLSDPDGTILADRLHGAMQCGKTEGMILTTAEEMAESYLELYRRNRKAGAV